MKNEQMQYQVKKTVRFKLKPKQQNCFKDIIDELSNENLDTLETYNILKNFIQNFEKLYFYKENELTNKIYIKKQWVKEYSKDYYYSDNLKNRQFPLEDFQDEIINSWEDFKINIKNYGDEISKLQYEKSRRATTGLIIKKLLTRRSFRLIYLLIENSVLKNDIEYLLSKLLIDAQEIQLIFKLLEKEFLPAQSSGIVLTKASFNYFTIHKKPIDFQNEINNQQQKNVICIKVENNSFLDSFKSKYNNNTLYKHFENDLKNKKLLLYTTSKKHNENEIGLLNLLKLKIEKEKKEFNEFIQSKKEFKSLQDLNLDLFKNIKEEDYNIYLNLSNQIEKIATQRNDTSNEDEKKILREKIINLKKQRGDYLQLGKTPKYFKDYKNFAEFYGTVAQRYGNINAKIKGIEKEKEESQLLQYWSVLVKENNKIFIALIPKENDYAQNLRKLLLKNNNHSDNSNIQIFWFESMTFRALQKLCFGFVENNTHSNTFYEGIKKEFVKKNKYTNINRKGVGEFLKGEFELKEDKEKIQFYKDVLQSEYAKNVLQLPLTEIENTIINEEFITLDDFKLALQKICYKRFTIFNKNAVNDLTDNFKAIFFEITSKDIEKKENENLNNHTKIWFDFWNNKNEINHFTTRLNPEITITWREAKQSRINKYGINTGFYNPNMKNRYLNPQFTLVTTFNLNSLSPDYKLSFKELVEQKEIIENFNNYFDMSKFHYAMGIDTNDIELAVLSIVQKKDEIIIPQKISVYEILDVYFEKQGYIYDNVKGSILKKKPYKIIESPQLFLNENLYKKKFKEDNFNEMFQKLFRQKEVNAIDLTKAKLINGKIVINADIITRLNLYKLNAKRKIYKSLIKNPALKLEEDNFILKLDGKNIYSSNIEFNCIQPYSEVKSEIINYFNEQYKDEARTEEKINQYRRALVANMVGIINYLYQQFNAIISIEDLSYSNIENKRKNIEYNITRPLEWAIIKKMQTNGLIPPIKEYLNLKEKDNNIIKQFGILRFVSENETSTTCPNCGEKAYKNNKDEPYRNDKNNKIFYCEKCKYHNKENNFNIYDFHSNDEIAAYNIAKKGFDALSK